MRASLAWLKQLTRLDLDADRVAERLTSAGIEVEHMTQWGRGFDQIVVAEVRSKRAHPERDKLTLVEVFDGRETVQVVCGAANVPDVGGRVVLAGVGARLPGGLEISERKLGGELSRGMLCSETELEIGSDSDGILVLGQDTPAPAGTPIVEALQLTDTVLELGITPNRPDCLGHVGLARELCALFEAPLPEQVAKAPRSMAAALLGDDDRVFTLEGVDGSATGDVTAPANAASAPLTVHIVDPDRCPRYAAALVLGAQVGPAPFAVRYRLHVLGLRAINNIVDATNLILLGFGHPIHAFDLEAVAGPRIEVRRARAGERLRTLDGIERSLSDDDLLICDGAGPVALAGIMGGESSEIQAHTRHVLIECAYFEPRGIRRSSRRLGLHTDSSYRFERGVDPNAVPQVLAHAAALIAEVGRGTVVEAAIDQYPEPIEGLELTLRADRIEHLMGVRIPSDDVTAILNRLGFEASSTKSGGGEQWTVRVPTFRPDLCREVDLIEEVARVWGYDRIPAELPAVRASVETAPPVLQLIRRMREQAAAVGLYECVNYAFLAQRDLQAARVSTDAVALRNPLSEERAVLRTSLLPGLAANLRRAQHHQVRRFTAFEVARVFAPAAEGELPHERYELGLLIAGPRAGWLADGPGEVDFFDGKGYVQALTQALTGLAAETVPLEGDAAIGWLHPRRGAALRLAERVLGELGELHPEVVAALGLDGRPVYARIDVQRLLEAQEALGTRQARPLPRYPAVTRDLAVVVDASQWAGQVADVLRDAGGEWVEEVQLFDSYQGDPVPAGHKSLAFRLTYRNPEATLTDAQVDAAHGNVVRAAEKCFGARVR